MSVHSQKMIVPFGFVYQIKAWSIKDSSDNYCETEQDYNICFQICGNNRQEINAIKIVKQIEKKQEYYAGKK